MKITSIIKSGLFVLALYSCGQKETFEIPAGKVGLVGYGSLTSKESMEVTLGRPYKGPFEIIHLNDYQRRWNLLAPNPGFVYCIIQPDTIQPEAGVFLNIEERPGNALNACLFVIEESDLPGFDLRERRYQRIDVSNQIEEYTIVGGAVFAYIGLPEFTQEPEINNPTKHFISQNYLNTIEDAFSSLGEEFESEFIATTVPYHESLVLNCYVDR